MRAIRMTAGQEIECGAEELRAEGIRWEAFDPGRAEAAVQRMLTERGWTQVENVRRSTQRPQDEAEIVREADEHCHLEDEVRLLLEGQGLYDVRGRDEQWLRVWVQPGDLIVIPAKRYHRFLVGQVGDLCYAQPYGNRPSLIQLYRVSDEATRAG